MTSKLSVWITIICTAALALALAIVAQFSPTTPNVSLKDAAAVLSIITATAIGIERVIEIFWTIIGLTKDSWWPLNQISGQINGMLAGLDTQLQPFYNEAERKLQELENAGAQGQDKVAAARKTLADSKSQVAQLKSLAPDNQTIGLIVSTANDGIDRLQSILGAFDDTAPVAQGALNSLANYVTTLKDNPGRKLVSIYMGAIIGMVAAWIMGLDLFQATLGTGTSQAADTTNAQFLPHIGVALTGVVMGLGSNPTHELIRVLQEVKRKRRTENEDDRFARVR